MHIVRRRIAVFRVACAKRFISVHALRTDTVGTLELELGTLTKYHTSLERHMCLAGPCDTSCVESICGASCYISRGG